MGSSSQMLGPKGKEPDEREHFRNELVNHPHYKVYENVHDPERIRSLLVNEMRDSSVPEGTYYLRPGLKDDNHYFLTIKNSGGWIRHRHVLVKKDGFEIELRNKEEKATGSNLEDCIQKVLESFKNHNHLAPE